MQNLSQRAAFPHFVADIHLLLSLIVGLQVLLWTASGLFMSIFPVERVRSEHRLAEPAPADLARLRPFISIDDVLRAAPSPIHKLSLEILGERPVFVGATGKDQSVLIDARSGAVLSPINESFARAITAQAISGDDPILNARLIEADAPIEYRGPLPVWRIDLADEEKLSVYISPDTGRILARRSALWRDYDFLWSLHIMDYKNRENFNSALLIVFSLAAVVMSVAGLVLLFLRLPKRVRRPSPD